MQTFLIADTCKKSRYLMIPILCDTHNLSINQFYHIDGLVLRYLKNFRCLILGRYCSYPRLPQHLCIGNYLRIKTDQICVITIRNHKAGSFSDMSIGHKIFSRARFSTFLEIFRTNIFFDEFCLKLY